MVFDVDRFVADCVNAIAGGDGRVAVREILRDAMSRPAEIVTAFGDPSRAGVRTLHRSPNLTILHIVWPPSFTQVPHNHLLWAEIGVYSGREDNIFWRRKSPSIKSPIETVGAVALTAGTCHSLESDVIHSVTNPLDKVNAGLHVYGGDLVQGTPRSMWDGETLMEAPLSYQRDDRAEAAYNARLID
jgi:predicted metal-dependent enzyme (double-stranded beta helix superfamily)